MSILVPILHWKSQKLKEKLINSFFSEPYRRKWYWKTNNEANQLINKKNVIVLKQPLSYQLNLSFWLVSFPESLKNTTTTPSSFSTPYQYFSKLYEKCMFPSLSSFSLKFKIIFKRRFRFRKNNLTLIDLVNLIEKYLDIYSHVSGVFIDLQKAFDNVNHDILLGKL